MLKILNVKIPLHKSEDDAKKHIAKKLKTSKDNIINYTLIRKSLDTRKPSEAHFVCAFLCEVKNEKKLSKNLKDVSIYIDNSYVFPYKKIDKKSEIVIVGSGPSGLFCALMLARCSLKPIIIERGEMVEERKKTVEKLWSDAILNPNSNVQFGEGGAGTFSDGKLTCGVNDVRMDFIKKEFYSHGAPKDILTDSKPHIGTDYLYDVVKNIREEIISLGGKFLFSHLVTDINTIDNHIKSVEVKNLKDKKVFKIDVSHLIFAIGHSSRDTYEMLSKKNFNMELKPFSVGVRIEHKREYINKLQYKELFNDDSLASATYKLSCHIGDKGAYTFCMCPGGEVVCSSSEENMVCTNGMSYFSRDKENSNSAVLVSVGKEDFKSDDILSGVNFQRELEKKAFEIAGGTYLAPCQRLGDFLNGKKSESFGNVLPSYKPGVKLCDLNEILPEFVSETLKKAFTEFDGKMKGFLTDDALLTGVETRSSAPLRILRDENFESNIKGIYPIGEGAGYAGGIMSSACDGIKCAEKICERMKCKNTPKGQ